MSNIDDDTFLWITKRSAAIEKLRSRLNALPPGNEKFALRETATKSAGVETLAIIGWDRWCTLRNHLARVPRSLTTRKARGANVRAWDRPVRKRSRHKAA